jgi:hypothetical protein
MSIAIEAAELMERFQWLTPDAPIPHAYSLLTGAVYLVILGEEQEV